MQRHRLAYALATIDRHMKSPPRAGAPAAFPESPEGRPASCRQAVSAAGALVGMVCRVERLRRVVGIHARLDADIGQPLDTGDREGAKPLI